ncbi:hypothetical protein BHU72_11080 [Desulfuribacillus stibiiarsenatis]|uniref:Peptide ABC transporter permease n=1 Tax=Desulfuribacillus stibiiarsenatis TaxID=1390249 RepID=A0A1E5L2Q0_9FIRM|nr:anti-sigma-F factor Fin [Desulfuribacillus stibiiarsenatis]OEH84341.1 hypothetical protein BHU72_11080 [Desulfuribacillus stibiiarsenatis]
MKFIYHCKHCHTVIDILEADRTIEKDLGLQDLSQQEKDELLYFDAAEQSVYVRTVCDFCYEAIQANPELALVGSPLQ